ncbi:MAG TPA: hypothetical protein VE734_08600, partial [Terriglobales bacterium]|nr:hypothetical protein [Terriglobales bacterium]
GARPAHHHRGGGVSIKQGALATVNRAVIELPTSRLCAEPASRCQNELVLTAHRASAVGSVVVLMQSPVPADRQADAAQSNTYPKAKRFWAEIFSGKCE